MSKISKFFKEQVAPFATDVANFAVPGVITGTAVTMAVMPSVGGIILVPADFVLAIILFMLLAGIAFAIIKRVLISEIETEACLMQMYSQHLQQTK